MLLAKITITSWQELRAYCMSDIGSNASHRVMQSISQPMRLHNTVIPSADVQGKAKKETERRESIYRAWKITPKL